MAHPATDLPPADLGGPDERSQVGVPAVRVGGRQRVTGRQVYTGDLRLDGQLHVALVTLDCAHARIRAIDASAAYRVPGVRLVMTAADLPHPMPRFGPMRQDRPVLAAGTTMYHGEPVAAVAAETLAAAREAADAVQVDHEELPAVLTVAQALDPAAPLVQDPSTRDDELARTNVLRRWDFGWGDVTEHRAGLVIENTYRFPMITHFAIEPHVFVAAPEGDGIAVWSPVQHPFALQQVLATLLDLPVSKVHVVAPDPGGAFGGKQHAKLEPLLAFMALRLQRPVRLALTLEQTFQAVRRSAFEIHVRTGFGSDGRLVFQDMRCDGLMGAYADIAPRVISKAGYLAGGPYLLPAARTTVRALLSHTTPSTAFRGFGTPQLVWATESQMDEAARRLSIDPVRLRLLNLPRPGQRFGTGDRPCDGDWAQSVRLAAERIGWGAPLPEGHGRGLAIAIKSSATTGASYAIARLHTDGSATLLAGTSDMGQGARTILAQIGAEELGIDVGRVQVVMGDTSGVPFDLQTSASRSTVFMGTAVERACGQVRDKLRQLACETFDLGPAEVVVERGLVRLPGRELTFVELMAAAFAGVRGEVIGVGERRGERLPDHPLGGLPAFYEFGCTAAEVAVDEETGDLRVVDLVSIADVGKAINPAQVRSQDEGAAVMGLGHTLMEHVLLDERGRIRNLGALDYRIPTIKDIPATMRSYVVENGDGPGPYGSKGAGEGGLFAVAPAVAAALAQACGVVIRDLPLTPERVWRALRERDAAGEPDERAAAQ